MITYLIKKSNTSYICGNCRMEQKEIRDKCWFCDSFFSNYETLAVEENFDNIRARINERRTDNMITIKDVIDILVRRDHISYDEAAEWVEEVNDSITAALVRGDLMECEDILRIELGLEPDYLEAFLM